MLRNWVMLCSSSTTRIFSAAIVFTSRMSREPSGRTRHAERSTRKSHARDRPSTGRALEGKRSSVPLHDALRDGKAQTGSPFLGCKEGLRDPRQMLHRNPGAVIHELHDCLVRTGLAPAHGQGSALLQRLEGVAGQVEPHLAKLLAVPQDFAS